MENLIKFIKDHPGIPVTIQKSIRAQEFYWVSVDHGLTSSGGPDLQEAVSEALAAYERLRE